MFPPIRQMLAALERPLRRARGKRLGHKMENIITIEKRESEVAGLIDFAIAYCQR